MTSLVSLQDLVAEPAHEREPREWLDERPLAVERRRVALKGREFGGRGPELGEGVLGVTKSLGPTLPFTRSGLQGARGASAPHQSEPHLESNEQHHHLHG